MSSAVAANALAWRLACRLFSHGQPVLEATLLTRARMEPFDSRPNGAR